jgi:hypothetical protein
MDRKVGGYRESLDWPKLGPSLLIATALIVAIRTARWPAQFDEQYSELKLGREVEFAARVSSRVLSYLARSKEPLFPRRKEPWYQPADEDTPK